MEAAVAEIPLPVSAETDLMRALVLLASFLLSARSQGNVYEVHARVILLVVRAWLGPLGTHV